MTRRPPHRNSSRAVLVGVGAYDRIRPIPAVVNNIGDLHQLLTGPGGALKPGNCWKALNPAGVAELGDLIVRASEQAGDTLVVYYTGHGLLDPQGRLYLALPHTDPDRLAWTALPITTLKEAITRSRAHTRVLILDCCFSGRALDAQTDGPGMVLGQVDITGTYTITSSSRTETSHAPKGHRNTAFTAALLVVAARYPGLTLDELYRVTHQHLHRNAAPEPRRRADNNAGGLILFPSAVHPAPPLAATPRRSAPDSAPRPVVPPGPRIGRRRVLIGAAVAVPLTAATAAGITVLRSPSTSPRITGTPDAVLTGHTGAVYSVAFNPDGTRLATAGTDATVRLWDVATRKQSGEILTGHIGAVSSVAFNPDGTRLATAGTDGTVRLWDVATRKQSGEILTGHVGAVYSVAFDPGGNRLATAGNDGTVRLWDVAPHNQLGENLTGHVGAVYSVAFNPGGNRLATAGNDRTVRLWDVATHEQTRETLTGHTGIVISVVFNRDGTRLASASGDRTVRLWDVATHNQLGENLTGHTAPVGAVAFSPDGTLLATGSDDQTVRLWK